MIHEIKGRHEPSIYTITTIREDNLRRRTPGYFRTFDDARYTVVHNDCDISEDGYYKYAVIEKVCDGLYTVPRDEWWFVWSPEKEQYMLTEKPEKFKRVCAFGIG
jgi:hypothetical protein